MDREKKGHFDAPPARGFVYADRIVPDLLVDLRYTTHENFTGAPVPGYRAATRAIMTAAAAEALAQVQQEAKSLGLRLLVWDAYRPQAAVDAFMAWSRRPCVPMEKKAYYPCFSKETLFSRGLIASPSGHSRGSTIDLTLAREPRGGDTPREGVSLIDMGGTFDFFGPESATLFSGLTPARKANRLLLLDLMTRHGFDNLPSEWWHYTLKSEPFPNTYFNFEVHDQWHELDGSHPRSR